MRKTELRKLSHIEVCLKRNVERGKTGFEDVEFVNISLPELNIDEIDISAKLLNKKLSAPFIIEGMTGGHKKAEKINKELALAAEETNIAFGLGSQRAMLENPSLSYTYKVRDVAPNVFLIGNIGVPQLKEYPLKEIENALEEINADALSIHLNPLQEAIQVEGNKNFKGCTNIIEKVVSSLYLPIIAKEAGAGICGEVAEMLERIGVKVIDVGGAGGTSWSAVEVYRSKKGIKGFEEWGIPTVCSIVETTKKVKVPVIASGGVRSGIDAAKSIALGADYVGAALPFLRILNEKGVRGVINEINKWKAQLKIAMFLTNSKNLEELKKAKLLIMGKTAERLRLLGIPPETFVR